MTPTSRLPPQARSTTKRIMVSEENTNHGQRLTSAADSSTSTSSSRKITTAASTTSGGSNTGTISTATTTRSSLTKSGKRNPSATTTTTSSTTTIMSRSSPTFVSPATKPIIHKDRKQSMASAKDQSHTTTPTTWELSMKNITNNDISISSNNTLYETSQSYTSMADTAAVTNHNYGMVIPSSSTKEYSPAITSIDNNYNNNNSKRSIDDILKQADRIIVKIDQLLQSNNSINWNPHLPMSTTAPIHRNQQQQQQLQPQPSTQWNPNIHSNSNSLSNGSRSSSRSTDSKSNYIDGDPPSLSSYFLFAEDTTNNFTPIPIHRDRNPVITPPPPPLNLHGTTKNITSTSSSTNTNTSSTYHNHHEQQQQQQQQHEPQPQRRQQTERKKLPSEEEIISTCYRLDSDFLKVLDAIQLESTISNLRDSAQSTINLLHRTTQVAMAIQQENQQLRDSLHTPP